jgi:hypothetical protein
MTAGWESAIALTLFAIFGSDWLLGIILLAVFSVGVLIMRPPPGVSVLAIGLFAVLIFGVQVGSALCNDANHDGICENTTFGSIGGGLGLGVTAVVGISLLAAIMVYFGVKRVLRDY